jgi:uncharacterized OB-fold protein
MATEPVLVEHPLVNDPESRLWHATLESGTLLLFRCASCGQCRFPPMPSCPHCGAPGAGEPIPASGIGRVYSWVVVHIALDSAFANEVPYAIVTVNLDEGPRMFGRFVDQDCPLTVNLRVRAVQSAGLHGSILCFERARS